VTTVIEESATGVRIIKAFGRGSDMLRRFEKEARALRELNLESVRVRAGLWTLLVYIPNLNLAAILLLGGYGVIQGQLTIGGLGLAPGEAPAIDGRTGSGKTTLASLVTRLYDVSEGRITLDGHDLRELTLSSLRAQIGMAFEDPILFSASVRENLLMGRPEA